MKNFFALIVILFLLQPGTSLAHCDGIDGPVIKAAKVALENEDVNPVLIWVKKEHEKEIKDLFNRTLKMRKINAEAKEFADMYFFETLVRLHRQGEGAPYDGLKAAGRDLGPVIPLADKAIESNSVVDLENKIVNEVKNKLHHYFENVSKNKSYKNVDQGREYVEAYVEFMHYVEGLHAAINKSGHSEKAKDEHAH